jgi:predicted ATPase
MRVTQKGNAVKGISYRDRDYAFGEAMLALRAKIGLTQVELAQFIGVSRRTVGDWEAGNSYPKLEHLKQLVVLSLQHQAFPTGSEAEKIRVLWKSSHQKVLLDEAWLNGLLTPSPTQLTRDLEPSHVVKEASPTKSEKHASLILPFQPTAFVGRVTELAEIDALLGDPACRLLTLVGPGGIGKTRLAIEVATHQMERFQDGVVFVDLGSISTPNQIVSVIGSSLNLSFSGQGDPREQLLTYLRKRHTLLLLDNFEHLLEGCELVSELLSSAPRLSILVTSRERLNLSAEWLFDVGGLSYPSGDQSSLGAPKDVADYSAVQLFIQRATQMQPLFPLSEATLGIIVRICQHVDGMPLAIELAAANLRVLSLAEIEQQIRSNLDALTTTLRDIPARHRSLRAVFDHSWNLLSTPEQALFSRLAVFRGGCTAAAAVQVAGATLPALMKLVDKSLLRPVNAKGHPEPRFVLQGPLRDYALEKLTAQGEPDSLWRSHASYYLALAEEIDAHWDSPTSDAAVQQLDAEQDNLRAALQWARDGGDLAIGLQLAAALWRFWRRRSYFSEGRAWLEELLALCDDISDAKMLAARLRALNGAAWLASLQPDFAQAARLFEESMALRRALGETDSEASLLDNAARAWRSAGEYQRATPLMEEALAQHRALDDRGSLSVGGLGYSLYELGLVLREQGDFVRATALFEECVEFHRAREDREGVSIGLLGLSDVERDQGNIPRIRKFSEESLAIMRELGVQWAIGFALNNLAQAAYLEGDLGQAFALASESVSLYRAQKADTRLAEVLVTLGRILHAQGDLAAAQETLTEALQLAFVVGPRLTAVTALETLAGVTIEQGKVILSIHMLSVASTLRAQMSTPLRPIDQAPFEQALESARSKIAPEDFSAAWSEAERLPLEQIMRIIDWSAEPR